jgi:hypothetical protein
MRLSLYFFCFFTNDACLLTCWNVCDEIHALVYVITHQTPTNQKEKYFEGIDGSWNRILSGQNRPSHQQCLQYPALLTLISLLPFFIEPAN